MIVDRGRFDDRLRELCLSAGVRMLPGRASGVRRERDGFVIDIARKLERSELSASVVVDATGRASALARRLGATRVLYERLLAERSGVICEPGTSQTPVWLDVEAGRNGWTYSVAGPDGRSETWTIHRGRRPSSTKQAPVNASSVRLSRAAGDGWIAIGDAAAAFDPITSQGLVNALSSAFVAFKAISTTSGVGGSVALNYSRLVSATFDYSEVERAAIYQNMRSTGM